jgi:hypothetical protein
MNRFHLMVAPEVRVYVTQELCSQGFSQEDLQKLLQERFRRQDYDGGLIEGVRFVTGFVKKQDLKKTKP